MSESETWYDEDSQTVWVYYDFDEPETLVPNDELRDWIRALERGETEEGKPVDDVNYIFADEQSAEYNVQALTYAKIGAYVGDREEATEYEPDEDLPDFDTRSDFGIDE